MTIVNVKDLCYPDLEKKLDNYTSSKTNCKGEIITEINQLGDVCS